MDSSPEDADWISYPHVISNCNYLQAPEKPQVQHRVGGGVESKKARLKVHCLNNLDFLPLKRKVKPQGGQSFPRF